jgi:diguanylate cyclase (GGDEF)-like protein
VAGDRELSEVLSEFARTMLTDFPIQGILDRLVERIVAILPISGAGVTLISPTEGPHHVAASDTVALRFETLQTELGQGPCLDAYRTGKATLIPDLAAVERFSLFARRGAADGLCAVFAFPLRHGASRLGTLDLYRTETGELDRASMEAALTLADVAAAYLVNAQARADLVDLSVRAREQALHDPLTGLPNRVLFLERLAEAVSRSAQSGQMVAVIFADLDHFKLVNDRYGHRVGDEVLRAVSHRLSQTLRPGDTLGRMSGDEFVVLCENLEDLDEIQTIAHRIDLALGQSFQLTSATLEVSASVGIAFSGCGDHLPEQILHQADAAMYQAKRRGGARHAILDLREDRANDQVRLTYDLSRAVQHRELRLDYQPIVDTGDGRIVAYEGLLRWDRPLGALVPPATFIPLAEQSGLIVPIGRWVLDRACRDSATFPQPSGAGRSIHVNVSVHQLLDPGYAAGVAEVLTETGVEPGLVTLEVTESIFISDEARVLRVLNDLKMLGVRLALDDFGTGHSSLSHLHRFPVDTVKIDHSFVQTIMTDPTSHAIVAAMIGLAHALGMTIIAEGIENIEQHRQLATMRCDCCQGFYFSLPLKLHDVAETPETLPALDHQLGQGR